MFDEQAAATPAAAALIHPDGGVTSYRELREAAELVAGRLRALGVSGETPVGVCADRCPQAVVLLLAVLKSGGCYVPLDPVYPEQRLRHMADDAGLRTVVTAGAGGRAAAALLADEHRRIVDIEALLARTEPAATKAAGPVPAPHPGDAAYLVYTSGSTGTPKGVLVEHAAVANLAVGMREVGVAAGDRVLHFAPLAFDASTFEIWGALCNGAAVAVAPPGRLGLAELTGFLADAAVTAAWLSAGLFHELAVLDQPLPPTLRLLLAGGDVLRADAVRAIAARAPELVLVNGYGPTECTTFTTVHTGLSAPAELARLADPAATVPIGHAVPGALLHVLAPDGTPVPDGAVGELHVGGAGLARGYHGRPGQTAERFRPDPFGGRPGARMYRTGDLVRRRADGALEFLGRVDRQVKIRGFRVEPAEVEAHLVANPEVRSAAVVALADDTGGARLVAYLVVGAGLADDPAGRLRAWLLGRVPEHLVPAVFVALPRLPLSPNGKVDLAALPEPTERVRPAEPQTAPASPMHRLVAEIWQEVLGVAAVGVDDNFFELGGDSLRMNRVAARLRSATGLPISLADLLVVETAGELAEHLNSLADQDGDMALLSADQPASG